MHTPEDGNPHRESSFWKPSEFLLKDHLQQLWEESQLEELPVRDFEELQKLRVGHILCVGSDEEAAPYEAGFFVAEGCSIGSVLYRMFYVCDHESVVAPDNVFFSPYSSRRSPLEIDPDALYGDHVVLTSKLEEGIAQYTFENPQLSILQFNDAEIKRLVRRYTRHARASEWLSIAAWGTGFISIASSIAANTQYDEPTIRDPYSMTAGGTLFIGWLSAISRDASRKKQLFAQSQLRDRFDEMLPENTPLKGFIASVLQEE